MAEKKVWTNADLKTRQAPDEYGPWTQIGSPDAITGMQSAAGTSDIDAALASAREFLARTDPMRPTRENAERVQLDRNSATAQQNLTAAQSRGADIASRSFTDKALGSLDTAAMPAAFVPGIGAPAGAYLALRGLSDAAKDPNALNVGMAGLGAIPLVRGARGLMRGGRALGKADDVAGVVDRFTPNTSPSRTSMRPSEGGYVANQGSAGRAAEAPGQAAPWTRQGPVTDRFTPNTPADEIAQRFTGDELHPSVRGMESVVDRYMPNISGSAEDLFQQAEQATRGASGRAVSSIDDLADTISVVDDTPVAQVGTAAPDEAASMLAELSRQAAAGPASRTVQRVAPQATRVPMGRTGNEYQGVKPFNTANDLDPEEAAAAPEFWDEELEAMLNGMFGRR